MNAEELKRLEEIKVRVRNDGYWPTGAEVDWVIARFETEAQENERLQQRERDLIGLNDIDVHEGMAWCDKAKAAEATCKSLLEQSSRREAQALEAGVRIAELEALFALQQTRMAEATEAWHKATGKHDVLPDLGDLLAWLMTRSAAMEAQRLEAGAQVRELEALVRELRDTANPVADERNITGAEEYVVVSLTPEEWRAIRDAVTRADKALAGAASKPQEGDTSLPSDEEMEAVRKTQAESEPSNEPQEGKE